MLLHPLLVLCVLRRGSFAGGTDRDLSARGDHATGWLLFQRHARADPVVRSLLLGWHRGMPAHVWQVLNGWGVDSRPRVGVLILTYFFLQPVSNRTILYLLLTNPVKHTLLILLKLVYQIKIWIIFILYFHHLLLACQWGGVGCVVVDLTCLYLDGLGHLLRDLIWETWGWRGTHWCAMQIVVVGCYIQVNLLCCSDRRILWRRFWLLWLCLLVYVLILHLLFVQVVHFALVTREALRHCSCSGILLKTFVIFLVWHGVFPIRIYMNLPLS